MKYMISLFLIVFIIPQLFAQKTTDTIHWQTNYKLKWSDFMGVKEANVDGDGVSYIGFVLNTQYINDSSLKFDVSTVFYKRKSWLTKPLYDSSYILNHEQGHFNINQVYALKLRQNLNSLKINNFSSEKYVFEAAIKSMFNAMQSDCVAMNALYDNETNKSIDKIKQAEWDSKIQLLLELNKGLD